MRLLCKFLGHRWETDHDLTRALRQVVVACTRCGETR